MELDVDTTLVRVALVCDTCHQQAEACKEFVRSGDPCTRLTSGGAYTCPDGIMTTVFAPRDWTGEWSEAFEGRA